MKQELEKLLEQNKSFLVEGFINKNKLADLARQYDPELLNILLSKKKLRSISFQRWIWESKFLRKMYFCNFLIIKNFYQIALQHTRLRLVLQMATNTYLKTMKLSLTFHIRIVS